MKSKNLSENIFKSVRSKGFKYIKLDSVIETNHIVERSGESFRRFIFSFNDQNGNELCLRPDLTIASCLKYLNDNAKGTRKVFYSGQAFRKTLNRTDPIIKNQIGFEIIGSKKEKEDDKKIIETSIKSLSKIFLTMAMAAIGMSTNLRDIKNMGYKPFVVGFVGMATVGIVCLGTIELYIYLFN